MTDWSPFRKLSGDEQNAITLKATNLICAVCGNTLQVGTRVMRTKPISRFRGVDKPYNAYPKYGGGISLNLTFRHMECKQ